MLDPEFKTTELTEAQSDVREDAVDPPEESRFDDGREGAVGPYEDGEDASSDAGEGAESVSDSGGAGRSGERGQTREENSAIRAARIRARREAEAAERARADEAIAASGIINPYTGRPFATLAEFSEYGRRLKASEQAEASAGGTEQTQEDEDRRFLHQLRRREEENAKQEAAQQKRLDFIADDVLRFVEEYPEFDDPDKLRALENNESFREFCGSRFGSEPLSRLYGAYKKLVGRAGAEAAAKSASRSERSTGSGGAGGEALTPSQKKALDRWNAENPDMAMTAKEFLSR